MIYGLWSVSDRCGPSDGVGCWDAEGLRQELLLWDTHKACCFLAAWHSGSHVPETFFQHLVQALGEKVLLTQQVWCLCSIIMILALCGILLTGPLACLSWLATARAWHGFMWGMSQLQFKSWSISACSMRSSVTFSPVILCSRSVFW